MNNIRYLVLSVVVALGITLVGCSNKVPERVQGSSSPVIQENGMSEAASIKVGTIDTKDGKNLKISMAGGTKNNFGELSFHKGETFTISVESKYQGELEIGIMSITTEQVFSDIVSVEKGEFIIKIPEDGDYRIYVGNKDVKSTTFDLKLSKAIEGPIV
ncbi:hypothetical protein ACWGXJ_25355 [Paenibacillus sp. S33]